MDELGNGWLGALTDASLSYAPHRFKNIEGQNHGKDGAGYFLRGAGLLLAGRDAAHVHHHGSIFCFHRERPFDAIFVREFSVAFAT